MQPLTYLVFIGMRCCCMWCMAESKRRLLQTSKPSLHFSWETVPFSVKGYYNQWAWKAMCDSSFPAPSLSSAEAQPQTALQKTECKHFYPVGEHNSFWSIGETLLLSDYCFFWLGDEIRVVMIRGTVVDFRVLLKHQDELKEERLGHGSWSCYPSETIEYCF